MFHTQSILSRFNALWLSVFVVGADQLSKKAIMTSMSLYETHKVLPIFNLTYVTNKGISFGLLDRIPFLLTVIVTFFCFYIGYWLVTAKTVLEKAAYSLILGGALGNLCDRLAYGFVIDFIDVHIKDIHFWIFNVADMAISLGILILILVHFNVQSKKE